MRWNRHRRQFLWSIDRQPFPFLWLVGKCAALTRKNPLRRPVPMPSSTVENYLKAILRLQPEENALVTTGELAADLAVTPGTVTSMAKQLQRDGFAHYEARQGLRLTPAGRKEALAVLRRHRLLETFLVEVMKLDWAEVHEEAEILEHAISERLLARIDEMLGHPKADPHGAPIPDARGRLVPCSAKPLAEARCGRWRVVRIADEDSAFLQWLQEQQLVPGVEVQILAADAQAELLRLKHLGQQQEISLGVPAAARLLVEPA